MAKKKKPARKAPRAAKRKSARRASAKRRSAGRAAAKKPARKSAKRRKAKPPGIGKRIAAAVGAVIGTLAEAEQLHTKTAHKAGFQELE